MLRDGFADGSAFGLPVESGLWKNWLQCYCGVKQIQLAEVRRVIGLPSSEPNFALFAGEIIAQSVFEMPPAVVVAC